MAGMTPAFTFLLSIVMMVVLECIEIIPYGYKSRIVSSKI